MTNSQVLTKAIERAVEGSYKPDGISDVSSFKATIRNGQAWVRWFNNEGKEVIQDLEHVIFSIPFAKALFGEEPELKRLDRADHHPTPDSWTLPEIQAPAWKHHLQQLAISEDRLAYLRGYMEKHS